MALSEALAGLAVGLRDGFTVCGNLEKYQINAIVLTCCLIWV
jgi:hypothetical protein